MTSSKSIADEATAFNEARAHTGAESHVAIPAEATEASKLAQAGSALRESEERYRTLFEAMDQGFCVIDMIFDEAGKPLDYRFLEINPAFAGLTGLENAIGRTAREMLPGLEPHWFAIYGQVAATGESTRFVEGSEVMGRWFDVYASRIGGDGSTRVALLFTNITERVFTERSLLESEERAAVALQIAQLGTWTWYPDRGEIVADARSREICGLDRETPPLSLGDVTLRIHPEDVTRVEAALQEALRPQGTGVYSEECRWVHRDGAVRWSICRGATLFRGEGALRTPSMMVGTVLDITERRLADEELRESEVRFRQMMDALPTAVYTTDADGLVTYFNPAAVEFSGRTPELGTDHWCVTWKLYHPDGTPMPHDECPMAMSLKEGRAIHGMEAVAERPDGTRRWFEPYPTPLRDGQGNLTGGINMLVDITERKRVEEELRESEERFRGLFHSAPVAVFVCDGAGVVQAYNSYAAELWGREPVCGDPKEVNCGSMLLRHPNGDLLPHAESPIVDVLRTGEPHHGAEVIIDRPDGSQVSVLVNFASLKDASGKVTGAITSFVDITERKQIEEELREAARLKDDLLGLVAHEFRTPLTTITGNIDVLVRRFNELPPEMRDQALSEIQRGSDRLRRLIQNMLVVARGERGKDEELEPLLLQRTLQEVVASEQGRDRSRPITLTASPGLPPVVASAGYLEQVVENLITNARKYSHIATPIEISALVDGGSAVVRVRDHGDVLDEGKVERFFEPFYRSEDAPRQVGGAGLGLAVCATLVERMEGKIWARPNPGGGLEVLFSLPLAHLDGDE